MLKNLKALVFILVVSIFIGTGTEAVKAKDILKDEKALVIQQHTYLNHFVTKSGDLILYMEDANRNTKAVCYSKTGKVKWRIQMGKDIDVEWSCELGSGKILCGGDWIDQYFYILDTKKKKVKSIYMENYLTEEEYIERIFYTAENSYIVLKRKNGIRDSNPYTYEEAHLLFYEKNKQLISDKVLRLDGKFVDAALSGQEMTYIDRVEQVGSDYYVIGENLDNSTYYIHRIDGSGRVIDSWQEQGEEITNIYPESIGGYSVVYDHRIKYVDYPLNSKKVVKNIKKNGYKEWVGSFKYKGNYIVIAAHRGMMAGPAVKQGFLVYDKQGALKHKAKFPMKECLLDNKVELLGQNRFVSISSSDYEKLITLSFEKILL